MLLTDELAETLAKHAMGNPRAMMNLASEYLSVGLRKESTQLDSGLFFESFPLPNSQFAGRRKSRIASVTR